MKPLIAPSEAASDIVRYLGFDPSRTVAISFELRAGCVATLNVEMHLDESTAYGLAAKLKRYKLVDMDAD